MIWCVEDDPAIREIEVYALNSTGLDSRGFENGTQLWQALEGETPGLILLDVMLPGEDGVTILQRLRADERYRDIPVIMATARGTEFDKVQSLDLGADDYITKPFGMMEMVSRVKAVLRRTQPRQSAALLKLGGLTLDENQHTVAINGQRVVLTFKEYEILYLFMTNQGRVFTREQIIESIWGIEYLGESRTVDVHVGTLRGKLKQAGAEGISISTLRSVGYKLEAG